MTNYVFKSKVLKIEQKSRVLRAWKEGDDVKTDIEQLGWFMLLEGSFESIYMGEEKPAFGVGQSVTVTIKPV